MGNAVNLQTKQVRKIIQELHRDHVVCVYVVAGVYCDLNETNMCMNSIVKH